LPAIVQPQESVTSEGDSAAAQPTNEELQAIKQNKLDKLKEQMFPFLLGSEAQNWAPNGTNFMRSRAMYEAFVGSCEEYKC